MDPAPTPSAGPAAADGAALAVSALHVRYDDVVAVDGATFAVGEGSVCALLGPNGAGKTTTVECLAGFRRPDGGSVRVLGFDPRRERAAVTAVLGVVLQEGGAYQAATPREIVRLFSRFYRAPEPPDALLERVGLGASDRTPFRALSGGQKQRVALALALVGRPRAVLLDEPTAGLDPQARAATWDLVRALRDDGVAVLLTTHAMDEAERLADRVVILDRGRVLAQGSPAQLVAGDGPGQLLVTTPDRIDAALLARAVAAPVRPDGEGRWIVDAGQEAIAPIGAWFAEQGLRLTGVSTAAGGLEAVYLRLTGREVRS